MVYCRAPSKGCERCRKRKVKCDEGRPGCLKCAKLKQQCPGYRILEDLRIRDESDLVARRHRRQDENSSVVWIPQEVSVRSLRSNTRAPGEGLLAVSPWSAMTVPYPLSQSNYDLGANFFFIKYSPDDGTAFSNYHAWLTKSYLDQGPNNVLRKVIEAVGMAGLSNVFYAPQVNSEARAQYCAALISMQQALNDPVQAVSDTTFRELSLTSLWTVNYESLDRYPHWAAHIRAGTAVLELRGQEQFSSERGALLYVQFRSYLLLACMQEHIAVPNALVKATFSFQTGALRQNWQRANIASPGSITEICFRVANLCAALSGQQVTDPENIRAIALEIDADLKTWRAGLPPSWTYATVHVPDAGSGGNNTCFNGKKHVYTNLWNAEAWNYWRAARVFVNQLILQNEARSSKPDDSLMARALSVIRELSIDICTSTSSILSLLHSLFLVALEERNDISVISFAVEQLRIIRATMGVRQASFMADTAMKKCQVTSRRVDGRFTADIDVYGTLTPSGG